MACFLLLSWRLTKDDGLAPTKLSSNVTEDAFTPSQADYWLKASRLHPTSRILSGYRLATDWRPFIYSEKLCLFSRPVFFLPRPDPKSISSTDPRLSIRSCYATPYASRSHASQGECRTQKVTQWQLRQTTVTQGVETGGWKVHRATVIHIASAKKKMGLSRKFCVK